MSRRVAREILYQLVFEYLFLKDTKTDTLDLMLLDSELTVEDKTYIKSAYGGVSDEIDSLIDEVGSLSREFKIDRVFKTDLAALIVAMYEMKNCDEIPNAVSINEAVNIVKKFSTEKSAGYVNGVLAGYLRKQAGGGESFKAEAGGEELFKAEAGGEESFKAEAGGGEFF